MNNLHRRARIIADFQFGWGTGNILFPDSVVFTLSRTRRISQILDNGERISTLRSSDGLLTLSIEGAKRLHRFIKYPGLRVDLEQYH